MKVKTIGIVLETNADAVKSGNGNLDQLYHWREPDEIQAITDAVQSAGFKTIIIGPPEKFCLEVQKYKNQVDFIFNLSVGFTTRFRLSRGPNLYELSGIPYSGADPYTKMVSQNKHLMKSFLDKMNIPTPEWCYIHSRGDMKVAKYPKFPVIVKPAYEGSSIGIHPKSVAANKHSLYKNINKIFNELKMPVIVEKFIEGKEVKIGIIGNDRIDFIGIIEDVINEGCSLKNKFLYYKAKTHGKYAKSKRNMKDEEISNAIKDSLKIYKYFLPVDYGTMDIRIDSNGNHYFLEFNADATLHPGRTLSMCCKLNGISFEEMINKIIRTSFKRWNLH